jgi:hypothetical protein
VTIALNALYSKLVESSSHPRILRFQAEFTRLHDSAVQLECAGVPDIEIFQYIRREFTQIFSLELPEEITGNLQRMQVPEGTAWEYALLAMSAAVTISIDAHPDRPGEVGVDLQRRSAIRQFLMKQYPAMYDVLQQEQYYNCDSAKLLEVLQRYQKAGHMAGPMRFSGEPTLCTAPYGDPKALKKREHQRDHDREAQQQHRQRDDWRNRREGKSADAVFAVDSVAPAAAAAAPNAAYQRQLDDHDAKDQCSNCFEHGHYWGWCRKPFNAANAAKARAAGRSAPEDERHFRRTTKRVASEGKACPIDRVRRAEASK